VVSLRSLDYITIDRFSSVIGGQSPPGFALFTPSAMLFAHCTNIMHPTPIKSDFSTNFELSALSYYTQRRNYLHITLFVIYGKKPTDNDIHAVRCVCMNNDLCRSV